jgi:hypothetical protein
MHFLLAAAAIATQAPTEPLTFERMDAMQKLMPAVCANSMKLTPPGGSYGDTLFLYTDAVTNTEKLFVLVVCRNYLKGLTRETE